MFLFWKCLLHLLICSEITWLWSTPSFFMAEVRQRAWKLRGSLRDKAAHWGSRWPRPCWKTAQRVSLWSGLVCEHGPHITGNISGVSCIDKNQHYRDLRFHLHLAIYALGMHNDFNWLSELLIRSQNCFHWQLGTLQPQWRKAKFFTSEVCINTVSTFF